MYYSLTLILLAALIDGSTFGLVYRKTIPIPYNWSNFISISFPRCW